MERAIFDRPLVLLLTATIDPGTATVSIVRSDPATRRDDYLRAIQYWRDYPDNRVAGIVFCDNSGADLGDIRRRFRRMEGSREVEVLGFRGNDCPNRMHYGYAELGTVDHALAASKLLHGASHFAKVTGRLVFPRLTRLLNSHERHLLMSFDSRSAYAREEGPRTRARTQLMLFDTDFYRRELVGRRAEMHGLCSHIEEYFAVKGQAYTSLPGVSMRWRVECPPRGIGGNGTNFDSWPQRAKTMIRGGLRMIVPPLWL